LDNFCTFTVAGVGDRESNIDGGIGGGNFEVVIIECGVREAMTKGEECRATNFVVVAIADVDILTVEDTATLGTVIEEGLIVLDAVWKGDWQFATLWEVS